MLLVEVLATWHLFTSLSHPCNGLSTSVLAVTVKCSSLPALMQTISPGDLIPFRREWYLDTKIWVLGMLIPSAVLLLTSSSKAELEVPCIRRPTDTLIPVQYCRIPPSFLLVFVTSVSFYHQYICFIVSYWYLIFFINKYALIMKQEKVLNFGKIQVQRKEMCFEEWAKCYHKFSSDS